MKNRINRFDDFFRNRVYLEFKKHLYNYLVRKSEILRELKIIRTSAVLEIGSGVSPIGESCPNACLSDISWEAMRTLRKWGIGRRHVVMSVSQLPFPDGTFSAIVCSEVLEHVEDDRQALSAIRRALKPDGSLILTLPMNPWLWAFDDRFVRHYRRYRASTLEEMLRQAGFGDIRIRPVAGILEKITMLLAILSFYAIYRLRKITFQKPSERKPGLGLRVLLPIYKVVNRLWVCLVWLEAKCIPMSFCSIALIHCKKTKDMTQK